jgi:hypothetical protein
MVNGVAWYSADGDPIPAAVVDVEDDAVTNRAAGEHR